MLRIVNSRECYRKDFNKRYIMIIRMIIILISMFKCRISRGGKKFMLFNRVKF